MRRQPLGWSQLRLTSWHIAQGNSVRRADPARVLKLQARKRVLKIIFRTEELHSASPGLKRGPNRKPVLRQLQGAVAHVEDADTQSGAIRACELITQAAERIFLRINTWLSIFSAGFHQLNLITPATRRIRLKNLRFANLLFACIS
jgi:hypothetical protein